jgi:hypothetical protein
MRFRDQKLQVYLPNGPAAKIVPYSRPRGSRKA